LKKIFLNASHNQVRGSIWNLDVTKPEEVYKAGRGLYRSVSFRETLNNPIEETTTQEAAETSEKDFYLPFADYLVDELEECTKAIPLGGNLFKDKWGTPDVIGVEKSKPSDIVRHSDVLLAAEIKIDGDGIALITAFGQACAYKSFSHKVYMAVPKNSSQDDISRLESLAQILGIGLILFDSTNKGNPAWAIKVRATKHEPDMFYVNKYMRLGNIEKDLFS
jgi:hypothetical protein